MLHAVQWKKEIACNRSHRRRSRLLRTNERTNELPKSRKRAANHGVFVSCLFLCASFVRSLARLVQSISHSQTPIQQILYIKIRRHLSRRYIYLLINFHILCDYYAKFVAFALLLLLKLEIERRESTEVSSMIDGDDGSGKNFMT